MKYRLPLFIASTAVLALSFSCAKNLSKNPSDLAMSRGGIVAYEGAGLYASTGQGEGASLEWRAALDFGGSLRMAEGSSPRSFKVGNDNMQFIPIAADSSALSGLGDRLGDAPLWIREDYYAGEGAEAAVVIADCPIGEGRTLKRGELLAASRPQGGQTALGFIVDPITKSFASKVEIATSALSFSREDLRAAIALAKAAAARDADEAKAILEEGERSAGNSSLIADIKAKLGGDQGSAAAVAGPAMEALVAKFTVKQDGAALRKAPAEDAEVLAKLDMDDEVQSIERTPEAQDSTDGKARWYHLSSPIDGWIFGLDLLGAD